MTSNKEEMKKIKILTIIKACLAVGFSYLILVAIFLYFFPASENKLIRKTAGIFSYPAASVGFSFVSFDGAEGNLESVRTFYESQDFSTFGLRVDFSTPDGKKRLEIKRKEILNKMIEDLIIKKEAEKRGIEITADIIDQEVDRKLKEYGTGDYLRENLKKLYGWDLEDFKKNIVKPDLYREELAKNIIENDSTYVESGEKIKKALEELENGVAFSEVAIKYSDGESAKKGGELGWFSADQMLPEVAVKVFNLEKNEQSEIIQSSIGYHIVKVEDKKQENETDMLKISQIFVPTKSFPVWLLEAGKLHTIFIFSHNLVWNNESGQIEFKNEEMKNYEENLLKNPTNDPSLMF